MAQGISDSMQSFSFQEHKLRFKPLEAWKSCCDSSNNIENIQYIEHKSSFQIQLLYFPKICSHHKYQYRR